MGGELEAEQESWSSTAYNSEIGSPSQRQLPARATATKGKVLGLKGVKQCVLYWASTTGERERGRNEGLFLEIEGEHQP